MVQTEEKRRAEEGERVPESLTRAGARLFRLIHKDENEAVFARGYTWFAEGEICFGRMRELSKAYFKPALQFGQSWSRAFRRFLALDPAKASTPTGKRKYALLKHA